SSFACLLRLPFFQVRRLQVSLRSWPCVPLNRLLLRDRALARALSGPGVGPGALTVHRKPTAVAHPPVAADFHQPLDVHRDLFPEVALDPALLFEHTADLAHIVLGEIL